MPFTRSFSYKDIGIPSSFLSHPQVFVISTSVIGSKIFTSNMCWKTKQDVKPYSTVKALLKMTDPEKLAQLTTAMSKGQPLGLFNCGY